MLTYTNTITITRARAHTHTHTHTHARARARTRTHMRTLTGVFMIRTPVNPNQGCLTFNWVRETSDHGNFNSWDRLPFYTATTGHASTDVVESQVRNRIVDGSKHTVDCKPLLASSVVFFAAALACTLWLCLIGAPPSLKDSV